MITPRENLSTWQHQEKLYILYTYDYKVKVKIIEKKIKRELNAQPQNSN